MGEKEVPIDPKCFKGLNTICFVCSKKITEEDAVEKNNPPMKMMGVPGWIHRKCKKDSESFLINSHFNYKEL